MPSFRCFDIKSKSEPFACYKDLVRIILTCDCPQSLIQCSKRVHLLFFGGAKLNSKGCKCSPRGCIYDFRGKAPFFLLLLRVLVEF